MSESNSPPIPQPKTFGLLGNLPQLNLEAPVQSMVQLAEEYGPIFRIDLPGRSEIFISGHELVKDACDESRFDKNVWAPLRSVRAFTGDGLFTSETEEPNWQKAHNILLPSFSQSAMRGYHEMMVDIAVQLIQKWSRLNPDESIDVPEDMTRLTLDTIGLCGFNYRFNSFYRDQPHPFITSMVRGLSEAMHQLQRLNIQDKLMVVTKRQYRHDIQFMYSLVDKIIAERKQQPDEAGQDLLSHMLNGKDPATGESLHDENIRYQIITFLIAGHETTSGLLSFAIYYLLKHPECLQKAYEEVDHVLTDPVPTYAQVRQLPYIRMILNESLRLWPTAPAFSLFAKEDTLLAGKYPLAKGESVNVLVPRLHRDLAVWGKDAEQFRPERFEDPSQIPHHAYKPFGNGQRACIGQQFALQEAALVLGMVLKHFEIIDHTNYQLKVKEALTLKPDDFQIRIRLRKQLGAGALSEKGAMGSESESHESAQQQAPLAEAHDTPLLVLYGSNLGTAEGIARELADEGRYQGFRSEVAPLNDYVGKIPKTGALLIVTSSYNGRPPSNAQAFVEWLEQLDDGELEGVRYSVFGCGDHNWASTYQDVPRFVDEQMQKMGAKRLMMRGEGDASGDFELNVESWRSKLWPDMMNALGLQLSKQSEAVRSTLTVEFVKDYAGSRLANSYEAVHAEVVSNRELQQAGSGRSTRHIEIALPDGVTYEEGDHLGVLPRNHISQVNRVLQRFALNGSDHLIVNASGRSAAHLPTGQPVSLSDLFSHSVELQEAATRAQLRELASYTACPPHRRELESLLDEDKYVAEVLRKRVSMLDLLEKYEACEMPFERFLELLPPLKARYYSISSSPCIQEKQASITVGVVLGPAWSGMGEYRGVASNYLASREAGDSILMFVRTPESKFQPPADPATPIIMVGPGTGVAPFRGFLQARQALQQEGKSLGQAILYYGCRNEADYLYREELERYVQDGIVTVHIAFSRKEGEAKTYVQHIIAQHAEQIVELLDEGAHLYICGDGSKMAPDVESTVRQAYQNVHHVQEEEAKHWLERLQAEGKFAKDVWSGL